MCKYTETENAKLMWGFGAFLLFRLADSLVGKAEKRHSYSEYYTARNLIVAQKKAQSSQAMLVLNVYII